MSRRNEFVSSVSQAVAFEYDRNARFAGTTKYPLTKMIGFAADALVSFSMVLLRIATYIGALLTTVLTFVGIWAVIGWIISGTLPGWTSLTLLVVMISSVQLLVLGLIGEYVGRTYIQSKHRPLFVISHLHRRARLPDRPPHDRPAGSVAVTRHSRCCKPSWMPRRPSRFSTRSPGEGGPESCRAVSGRAVSGLPERRRLLS